MNVSDGGGHGQSQDFDINLAPIIDCFTVLITFLLASASFLAIGVFEASVAVSGSAAAPTKPPSIRVDVELAPNYEIHLRLATASSNTVKKLLPVNMKNREWNVAQLLLELDEVKAKHSDANTVVLTGANDVEYVHIVKLMETMRSRIPNILLGGY